MVLQQEFTSIYQNIHDAYRLEVWTAIAFFAAIIAVFLFTFILFVSFVAIGAISSTTDPNYVTGFFQSQVQPGY